MINPLPASLSEQLRSTHGVGWSLALGTTLAQSIVTPLARSVILGGLSPTLMLLIRLSLAVLLLAVTLAWLDRRRLWLDHRGLVIVSLIGIISGIEICCFFWSLAFVDASMASMIKSVQPLAVLIFLQFGGERMTHRHVVRLLLAFIGVYLLIGPGGQVAPMGLFLLFISVVFYAAQLVFTQWYLRDYDTGTITVYLLAVMTGVVALWWGVEGAPWHTPTPYDWLVIIILVTVSTYFARLALYGAVWRIGSGQVALLWPLQILLSILFAVLLLNEQLTPLQWLGGAFVLTSALMAIQRLGSARSWLPRRTQKEQVTNDHRN
jgi:drug/metabolite transporter (DMT)-like permease